MPNDAELKRRDSSNALQNWTLRDPATVDGGLYTDPVSEAYLRDFFAPKSLTGTITATGIPTGLTTSIDTSKSAAAYVHLRIVPNVLPAPPNFVGTIVVEGTNDPAATDNWTALTLHSPSSGARSSSAKNGGIYLIVNLPRWIRVRCSAFTSGTATVDILLKPLQEQSPGRYVTDADGLTRWAFTTFGVGIVTQKTFLCGGDFGKQPMLDTNQWVDQSANGGSLVFGNGEVELRTGTDPAGLARVQTARAANFLGGSDNEIQIVCRQGDTGGADHVYRFGIYDDQNGAFIEINSTGLTFKVRKNGVDAESPFGVLGVVTPTNTVTNQFWFITFNPNLIIFRQGASFVQLQVGSASLDTLFADTTLPVTCEAINLSGTTSHSLYVQTAAANRLGQPHTVRADEPFQAEDVLAATAAVVQGQDPNGLFTHLRTQGRHLGNCTVVPLNGNTGGIDHIFLGEWFEWQAYYGGSIIDMVSDVSGTLFIDFAEINTVPDVNGADTIQSIQIAYNPSEGLLRRTIPVQARWMRCRYVNGLTAQSTFNLDTAFVVGATVPVSPLNSIPESRGLGSMGQSLVLAEQQEDQENFAHIPGTVGQSGSRGLNQHITGQDAALAIAPVQVLRTNSAYITDAAAVAIPAVPLTDRATICYSNLSEDIDIRLSEDPNKLPDSGGVIFPRSSKEFDLGAGQLIYFRLSDQGVASSTQQIGGTTTQNVISVTNPDNLKVSDNTDAIFNAVGDQVELTGFSITPTLTAVKNIRLKLEAGIATTPVSEQVAWVDVQTGTAGNVTSVVSSSVTANADHFYVAAISRKNTAAAVSSVTGMGLTWNLLDDVANSTETRISVYYATGVGAVSGAVTAAFSTVATNAVIAVHRFSGVNFSAPFTSHETLTSVGATGSYSDSLAAGTDRGMAVVCVTQQERTHTAGAGFTERNDTLSQIGGGGGSSASEATETAPITATGAVAYAGTISGNESWSLVAFALEPAVIYPAIRVRYKVSGGAFGTTSLTSTLTTTGDTTTLIDVTTDRAWTFADIPNITLTIDAPTMGAIPAEVDRVWLEVVETNAGAAALLVYEEVGGLL